MKKILPYRKLYFRHGLFGLAMSAIWTGYYVLDRRTGESDTLLTRFLPVVLLILAVFVTMTLFMVDAARRDREDELARENLAKTNSRFITVLAGIGFLAFIGCACLFSSPKKITVELHYAWIAALVYLLFAVYYFIAMYYEAKTDGRSGREGEEDA